MWSGNSEEGQGAHCVAGLLDGEDVVLQPGRDEDGRLPLGAVRQDAPGAVSPSPSGTAGPLIMPAEQPDLSDHNEHALQTSGEV